MEIHSVAQCFHCGPLSFTALKQSAGIVYLMQRL